MLFPSQSISGKEVGIEQFGSPKIERDAREGGREGGKKERERGRQRWSVCVCVCVRGRKGKTGRDSDKLTWGK